MIRINSENKFSFQFFHVFTKVDPFFYLQSERKRVRNSNRSTRTLLQLFPIDFTLKKGILLQNLKAVICRIYKLEKIW